LHCFTRPVASLIFKKVKQIVETKQGSNV
jgi:hypothetical protein